MSLKEKPRGNIAAGGLVNRKAEVVEPDRSLLDQSREVWHLPNGSQGRAKDMSCHGMRTEYPRCGNGKSGLADDGIEKRGVPPAGAKPMQGQRTPLIPAMSEPSFASSMNPPVDNNYTSASLPFRDDQRSVHK